MHTYTVYTCIYYIYLYIPTYVPIHTYYTYLHIPTYAHKHIRTYADTDIDILYNFFMSKYLHYDT